MNAQEILIDVQEVFRNVFDDDRLTIKRETNSNDILEWDSLTHINLVISIEKVFKIKFALGELQDLKNVGDMLDLIEKKIKR